MIKQSERQTQGQELLKQLKDEYRRPQVPSPGEVTEHPSGNLPDPQYWPAEISRGTN